MSSKEIYWTPIAVESLKEVTDFATKVWNLDIVDIILELIDLRLEQLKSNPLIAPKVKGTSFRKILIHKHVSLFYKVDISLIKVLLVWDNRQNPSDLHEKLTAGNNK